MMALNAGDFPSLRGKRTIQVLRILVLAQAGVLFLAELPCYAQTNVPSQFLPAVGDAPDSAPPLATDLSPALERAAIEKAMIKVADWQLERAKKDFDRDWTFAALYTGFMAASASTGNPKYSDAMLAMGRQFNWELATESKNADDDAVGRTYIALYLKHRDLEMIEPTRKKFDELMRGPEKPPQIQFPWWWCDALFMAPPAWAGMYKATGNIAYLDYMNREWWATSGRLYDHQEHLYFRDASFLNRKQANGRKLFWSRGNGWVMAGLAGVLEHMPENYPDRHLFVEQFREMSEAISKIQGSDGLWRTGLLDPDSYPLPENSGSAFFTYALAWGINRGILERSLYEPVVAKAWKGLLQHIYADGRFGCIQAVSDAPGKFKPTSSYVYGVGAFLLAGSEVDRLAQNKNSTVGAAAQQ